MDRLLTLKIKNDHNLQQLLLAYKKLVMKLIHITFVLCMVQGVEDDLSLYIGVLPETQYTHFDEDSSADMTFKVPDAENAFYSLSLLLLGPVERHSLGDTSVVSAWGWSLCLGSVACQDPSDAGTSLAFMRGVPARNGERKHYIVDGAWSLRKEALAYDYAKHSRLDISHRPGDQCILSSWTRVKDRRYYIGVKDDTFEVANILDYDDPAVNAKDKGRADHDSSFSCGFRSMQEVCWRVRHAPPCQHPATPGQSSLVLPENVFAFRGVGRPQLEIFQARCCARRLGRGGSLGALDPDGHDGPCLASELAEIGSGAAARAHCLSAEPRVLLRVRREVRAALQTGHSGWPCALIGMLWPRDFRQRDWNVGGRAL